MKKRITVFIALLLAVILAGCRNDAPGGEIQLGREFDFTGTGQIELTNMHNGKTTVLADEQDIAEKPSARAREAEKATMRAVTQSNSLMKTGSFSLLALEIPTAFTWARVTTATPFATFCPISRFRRM